MGGNISYDGDVQHSHIKQINVFSTPWGKKYSELVDSAENTVFLHARIFLDDHEEVKIMVQQFEALETLPFYLISPIDVRMEKKQNFCQSSSNADVYHPQLMPSLSQKMQELGLEGQRRMGEGQIWFVLSQLSRSLQILYERGHPHLWISPQTIYYNKNENWFLHDMYFWQGPDYQSNPFFQLSSDLIKSKLRSRELISNHTIQILARGQVVDIRAAMDEDVYLLGHSILFAMTNSHPTQPKNLSLGLLRECQDRYSQKLVNLVFSMIEEIPQRRISLHKLRHKLKVDQQKIIMLEMSDYRKAFEKKRVITDNASTRKKSDLLTPLNFCQFDRQRIQKLSTETTKLGRFYSPGHVPKRVSQFVSFSPRK